MKAFHHKFKVVSLVDRATGRAKSMVVDDLRANTLGPILAENIAKETTLMTDETGVYKGLGKGFADYQSVKHRMGEYVNRKNPEIHTNTIEGYFSIFKRGMKDVYRSRPWDRPERLVV